MSGGWDPCECINLFNHEGRMMRLLHMLRESQSECTDNECTTPGSGLAISGTGNGEFPMWMMMMIYIGLAVFLYISRRATQRNRGDQKPHNNGGGGGGNDPAPVF